MWKMYHWYCQSRLLRHTYQFQPFPISNYLYNFDVEQVRIESHIIMLLNFKNFSEDIEDIMTYPRWTNNIGFPVKITFPFLKAACHAIMELILHAKIC